MVAGNISWNEDYYATKANRKILKFKDSDILIYYYGKSRIINNAYNKTKKAS